MGSGELEEVARYWPAIAADYHIMPWDLERLTVRQFQDLRYLIDEARRQQG